MNRHDDDINPNGNSRPTDAAAVANQRRDDTLTRLRAALIEERLTVMDLSGENAGTDPYNTGTHRALTKAHVWDKRSR